MPHRSWAPGLRGDMLWRPRQLMVCCHSGEACLSLLRHATSHNRNQEPPHDVRTTKMSSKPKEQKDSQAHLFDVARSHGAMTPSHQATKPMLFLTQDDGTEHCVHPRLRTKENANNYEECVAGNLNHRLQTKDDMRQ